MEPRDDLALGETEYMLAKPGQSYIAYTSSGSGAMGVRNLDAGSYLMHWIDPKTGGDIEETMALESADREFARPPGYGGEAAVHLLKIEPESQK